MKNSARGISGRGAREKDSRLTEAFFRTCVGTMFLHNHQLLCDNTVNVLVKGNNKQCPQRTCCLPCERFPLWKINKAVNLRSTTKLRIKSQFSNCLICRKKQTKERERERDNSSLVTTNERMKDRNDAEERRGNRWGLLRGVR